MKDKILDGVRFFKENFPSDKGYIQMLQQMADLNYIDFKTFQSTGLFTKVDEFVRAVPNADIKDNCECIVVYVSTDYIQSLSNGFFARGNQVSKSLDEIEKTIYDEYKGSM